MHFNLDVYPGELKIYSNKFINPKKKKKKKRFDRFGLQKNKV